MWVVSQKGDYCSDKEDFGMSLRLHAIPSSCIVITAGFSMIVHPAQNKQ